MFEDREKLEGSIPESIDSEQVMWMEVENRMQTSISEIEPESGYLRAV